MYLAEDRILCWELVSKRDSAWILHYVKSAQAVTDVPDQVPELISQRRRWLNAPSFAGIHSIIKFGYIYRSSHSFGRKFALHIEIIYQTVQLVFSWFGMANFFIAFFILTSAMSDKISALKVPNLVLSYIYIAFIIFCFLLSMATDRRKQVWIYAGDGGVCASDGVHDRSCHLLGVSTILNATGANGPVPNRSSRIGSLSTSSFRWRRRSVSGPSQVSCSCNPCTWSPRSSSIYCSHLRSST